MTKKRFTLQESDIYNRNDVIHDKGIEMPQSTVCDLLNEQEELLNQIKKLCMDNRIPVCLTAYIPKNCEHYHACFENHTENAVSFGESKIANKILKIINGDGGVDD